MLLVDVHFGASTIRRSSASPKQGDVPIAARVVDREVD